MELTERQRKYLRGLGHPLKPVILIGNSGLTPGVIAETIRALDDHELIKVKVRSADRSARDQIFEGLETASQGSLVSRVGHVGLYYKRNLKKPGILIPDP